ncbi:T9SS type B sorting domain-containing protein [Flavobacterium sp. LS1R49]|uniref:T9SS type B sorting domain-containing protein n=1 Tax=Flavobacterium shii TaxID=2987687 RepID=A0A9X2ZJ48_9FLAO|nr:T9SS type B sorting domain-containing protein [Flavobacterium shii]MCV9929657.1 T9SS type B sorting domain-containing protein [Flavobacterium shii]
MKKPTILKFALFALIFFQSIISYSQNLKPFTSRFDKNLKGDMLLIGNSILNRDLNRNNNRPNDAYNDGGYNSDFSMQYIDIDNDNTTFSSSSANLKIPNPDCYKIVYAALYWGAILQSGNRSTINKVKLKMPTGGYNEITGEVIYDADKTPIGGDNNKPYACYANVTDLVANAALNPTPQGTYTVANVLSSVGGNSGTGLSAGWSLYIVYEDPKLPAKAITSFDGFSGIGGATTLDINVSGFRTIPAGPVRVKFAFSALEGDLPIPGDYLRINNTTISASNRAGTTIRAANNFFNSSVTYIDQTNPLSLTNENFLDRNPASKNTLGYDAGIISINNVNNTIINNGATSAVIRLGSTQDVYFYYFNAIAVDIIEPKIVLTKEVLDAAGKDIGNTPVVLGQELYYKIGFQNVGNDNADNFTIRDVLPINIIFDPANIIVPNGSKITYTYNAATRTIVFTVPKNLVEIDDPRYEINLKVKVVPTCNDLSDVCSNLIQNQAFGTYRGEINKTLITDDPSLSSFNSCFIGTPTSTNFLVGVDACIYTKEYQLCTASVKLTAANGYSSYSWSTSPTGVPVIGTTQSITVSQIGTYYVDNFAAAPCKSIKQVVTVTAFGSTTKNPVIPFADEVVICKNNGKELPKIILCGANATRLIRTGVTDANSIVWEKLDEASCNPMTMADCANESDTCTWKQVAIGQDYTANAEGQYRVVLNYAGGCFSRYYFNVYHNLLNPTAKSTDIICKTKGQIVVGGVGNDYEYSLSKAGPYQDSNIFDISTPNTYTVYIKQKGVLTNPCIFSVPGIDVRDRDFKVDVKVNNPLCNGDLGSIKIAAKNVREQYYYSISGTMVKSIGPIAQSDYTFDKLAPGTYTIKVTTDDGCLYTENVKVVEPAKLTATASLNVPLTACSEGEILVSPVGGTAPYSYFVNGSTEFQDYPQIPAATPGLYTIKVVDYNNCETTATITVDALQKPTPTITPNTITCYGVNNGEISITLNPANSGYTVSYSIDNGITFSTNPIFSNLAPGDYDVVVKYTYQGVDCLDASKAITIQGPAFALTASAGVAELSGCGLPGHENQGKVRITNAQGGVPFAAPNLYRYSFDGGNTWITSNEAYMEPSSTPYTLYIKDAAGCIYPMTGIVLDPKPADPTITVSTPTFNCDGNATTTVTVTNPAGTNYEYEYYLNNVKNPNTADPKVFLNVPPSAPGNPHIISVRYKLVSAPTFSNLLKEDFGSGPDATSPGINPAFCWERQVEATKCNGNKLFGNGEYTVTSSLKNNPYIGWHNPVDHTTGSATGRYLAVDAGNAIPNNAVLYRKVIKDIVPDQPIQVRFFATNLLKIGNTQPDASLTVELQNSAGVPLSSQSTGGIPKTNGWVEYNRTINPGANTTLDFVLRLEVSQIDGIDFAVDDIEVYQLPISCLSTVEFPVIVDPNKKFKADVTKPVSVSCNGTKDGSITITAENFDATKGYQYSIDNGVTWVTTTVSPLLVGGLGAAKYNVQVRYDEVSVGCTFPFTPEIGAPAIFEVNATATIAKCSEGATVTATGTGGTPGYTFTLTDKATPPNVTTFPSSGILKDIKPGTYTVSGVDANGCSDNKDTDLIIAAPVAPVATITQNTGLCFDNTKATITVSIIGGVAPYSYQVKYNTGTLSGSVPVTGSSFTYDATATGDYSFLITDAFGCADVAVSQKINPKITAKALTTTSLTCIAPKEAKIEVTISGGTSPFTYTVNGDLTNVITTPGPTFIYTTTIAGTYKFDITDKNKCTTTVDGVVDAITSPEVTATPTNPKCNGDSNGSVVLAGSLGSGGYEYSFDLKPFSTQTNYTGLKANVAYKYQVKDDKGCLSDIKEITLSQPDLIDGTAEISTAYTCDHPAVITVKTVSGGTPTYTYTLNKDGIKLVGPQGSKVFDNLTQGGIYTVTITDANACFKTIPVGTIVKLDPPTAMTLTPSALECPSNKVNVTISAVIGGTGTKSYAITAPAAATSNVTGASTGIFLGLAPGTYTFQVKDANNCTFEKPITIDALPEITIAAKVNTDIQCFGDTKGSATFTVSGLGNGTPYSYVIGSVTGTGISPGAGSSFNISVPGLSAGTHTIIVTNTTTKCEKSADVTIAGPTALLEITPAVTTGVTCLDKGTAVIEVTGGWGSYIYTVTQTLPVAGLPIVQTTKTFAGLVAGTYSVLVSDLKGCQVSQTFVIDDIVPIDAEIDLVASDFCYGAAGATIKVTPNTHANYVYSINGIKPAQNNGTFTGLIPGTYTIVVTDTATGCYKDLTVNTTIASPLTATIGLDKELDCDPTNPNAIIKVKIEKGYPNYKYRVNTTGAAFGGAYTDVGAGLTTFTYTTNTGSAAATYYFEITDSKGCITVVKQDIVAKVLPTASATQTNPACFGGATGSITITGNLGVGPYTYYVSTDDTTFTLMGSNVYANAGAGTYYFKVIDTKKCESASIKVILVDPPVLVVSAVATNLTCGANNISQPALITVTASGGTPMTGTDKYWYSYDGGSTYIKSNTFPVSTSQTVSIMVKDANDCTKATSVIIKPLTPPSPLTFVQKSLITCKTNEDVSDLEVTFTDGLAPFKYEITGPTPVVAAGILTNTYTFTNLAPGTYYFKVTDANKCTVTGNFEIKNVVPIQVTGQVKTAVTCNTALDGKIEFTVSGNTAIAYNYALVGSVSGTIAGGVKTGDVILYSGLKGGETYTITVTNTSTGCKASFGVALDEPTTITFTDVTATKVFCSKVETTITVVAAGGTAPLSYAVVKKGTTPALGSYTTNTVFTKDTSLDGLFYDVYVVDKNGCPSMKTIEVVRDAVPTIVPITTPLCYSGTAITVTITGTVYDTDLAAIKLYGIDGVYDTDPIKTISGPGTYILSIKDANGCEAKTTVIVGNQLSISASLDKDITCAIIPPFTTTNAQITVTANGGNGIYTYAYSADNGATWTDFPGNVFQTAATGDYYFRITSNGCSIETKVSVKVTTPINPNITKVEATEIKCVGDETAVLTITYDKTLGLAPYTFNVKNNTTGKDYGPLTTGLAAGNYTITITDAKGCTDSMDLPIAAPKPIVILHHELPISCVDDGLGNDNSVISMGSIIIDKITDGISTVGGSGGKGPYNYFVTGANGYKESELNNDGTTSVRFNVVDFGLYEIRVVDANGCTQIVSNVLVASIVTDLDIDIKTTASCDPAIGGTAVVKVGSTLSGNGPFHFAIYTGPGMKYPTVGTWQDETMLKGTTFTQLLPGVTYTFVIYDEATKCYHYQTADKPIPTNSTLQITKPEIQNVTCKGNADGKVSFVISTTYGVATPVKYQIFNAQSLVAIGPEVSATVPAAAPFLTVTSFGALPFGNYFILVKEDAGATNAGCSIASLPFDIVESGFALELTASVTKNSNTCVTNAGIITAIAKFGTANATTPYLYQIFPDTGVVGVLDGTDQKLIFPYDAGHVAFSATFDLALHKSNVFHKSAGNYIVYVKDAYGCIKEAFVTLKNDDAPTVTAPAAICFKDLPATVTVSGTVFTGSSITYSIGKGLPAVAVAGAYQTNPDFLIGTPGVYTFFVKDDNNCVAKAPFIVNDQILTDLKVIEELSCKTDPNATIHGIVSGGLGSGYTYQVKVDAGSFGAIIPIVGTTFDYSAATAGVYTFLITDGKCPITKEITVNDKVPTVFNTTVVDVKCNSGATGSIAVNVTSGSGKFEYKLDGPVSYPYQDSNIFGSLTAGTTYIVTVRNIKLCVTASTAITVGQPAPLALVTPVIVPLTCGVGNVAQSATVTIAATGGSTPYQYSFNNGDFGNQTVYTVVDTGLTQVIPYSIMDKFGCVESGTVTIDKLIPPTAFDLTQLTPITCDVQRTTVTITNVIGRPGATYSYATIAPSPVLVTNLTGSFPNLLPGDYVFQVTDIAYGCTYQEEYTIKEVVNIAATVESTTDISCLGTPDGKATLSVSGFGTGVTYTYIVNGGTPITGTDTVINLINLAAGHYIVDFKDNVTGCPATATFDIDAPALALTSSNVVTPLGCTTTGAVKITAVDGWGSYKYTLTSPTGIITTNNDGIFEGLTEVGLYNTSVKDAKGCIKTDSFSLTDPVKPVATIAATSDYCYVGTNTTTLVVTATSAAPHAVTPFMFSINNGQTWQNSGTFSDLAPGDYNAMVKDAFGCISVASATTIKEQLFANAVNKKELSCLVGNTNGSIRVTPTGGYAPYTYQVKIGAGTYFAIAATTATYTDYTVLASGSYRFLVTDAKGCTYETDAVVMTAPTPVDFTVVSKSPNCLATPGNISNGTITVTMAASNDNGPYTYVLEQVPPVAGTEITQGTGLFTGLPVGKYTVTVTSGRGCPVMKPIDIDAPDAVIATAVASPFVCASGNNPKTTVVTVTATGGTGTGFKYSEDNVEYFDSNVFDVDATTAESLTFYVKDSNECVASITIPIAAFPKLIAATVTYGPLMDCDNMKQVMNVAITGGTNTPKEFTYQAYKNDVAYGPLTTVTGRDFTFDAPDADSNYQFEVFDNNTTCSIKSVIQIVPVFNTIKVVANASAPAKCFGEANGTITINVTGYTGDYTYQVFKGGTPYPLENANTATGPVIITGLLAGDDYTVVVKATDYPKCSVTSNVVEITQPDVLDLNGLVVSNVNQNCRNLGAELTIDRTAIKGGTQEYSYGFAPKGTDYADVVFSSTDYIKTIPTTHTTAPFDEWDVYVKDANGCYIVKTVTIKLDPLPALTLAEPVSQCFDPLTETYTINVTASGVGPFEFSLDGQSFIAGPLTVKSQGIYDVYVKDANGCITPAIGAFTILDPLGLSAEISTYPTCNGNQGEITLTATGGNVTPATDYQYSIDSGAFGTDNVFKNLLPGTYTFTVKDMVTNCTKDLVKEILPATLVTGITLTPTHVSCNGGADGTIAVALDVINNDQPYKFSLVGDNGVTRLSQSTPLFKDLPVGIYTVKVISGRLCEALEVIEITQPLIITVPTPTPVQYGCTAGTNTVNHATITVSGVTGGTPTALDGSYPIYEFFRDGVSVQRGPETQYKEVDLLGGTYTVNVYDINGCMGSIGLPVKINPYISLDKIDIVVTAPITCPTKEEIMITVTTTGGTPALLKYTVVSTNGIPYNQTKTVSGNPVFTGLTVGNYIITVLNEATGCSIQDTHYVAEPNTFGLKATNAVSVTCFDSANGSIDLTITDSKSAPTDLSNGFSYTITGPTPSSGNSPNAGPFQISGLKAGNYTIVATLIGKPFCDVKSNFTIEGPTAALEIDKLTHTKITCVTGNNDGSISVSAKGGWSGSYEYQLELKATPGVAVAPWSWSTTSTFTGLTAGDYVVVVRDSGNCNVAGEVKLSIPTPIQVLASANVISVSCNGDKSGVITVNLTTGGVGSNYTYTLNTVSANPVISSGPTTNPVFSGLGAGTYTITATDGFSCFGTSLEIEIKEPTVVKASVSVSKTQTCLTQTELTLKAEGGTGPYTYSTDPTFTAPITFGNLTGGSITFPVSVGRHQYYVKDVNGCVSYIPVEFNNEPLEPLTIDLDLTNAIINCAGDATGRIIATAQGGLGNYVYTLSDATGNLQGPKADGIFTGLFAGTTYKVNVDSGDCQQAVAGIIITEPDTPLTIVDSKVSHVTCNGEKNGRIEIIASGGTGIIKYSISPNSNQFEDKNVFDKLAPGKYQVIVQDELGCFHNLPFEIVEPSILTARVLQPIIQEVCADDKDGAFSIEVKGGKSPYSYSLDKPTGTFLQGLAGEEIFNFENLSGGKHIVYVKDASGCTYEVEVIMDDPILLAPKAVVNYDCVNNAAANFVTITVDKSNTKLTDVEYSLDGAAFQPSNIFTNVAPGNHIIRAQHLNGCIQPTAEFKIEDIKPLTLTLTDGGLNEIVATATGGGGEYQYALDGEAYGSVNKFIIYKSGTYTVTVTDKNGCTATASRYFEYIDVCIPNHFTPNGDGVNDTWAPGCTVNYKDLTFDIFDRYGRVICKYKLGQKWDGRYNGAELPTGDYWYVLKLNDNKDDREFVGHFTLYR